jgi:hypothetical protein
LNNYALIVAVVLLCLATLVNRADLAGRIGDLETRLESLERGQ